MVRFKVSGVRKNEKGAIGLKHSGKWLCVFIGLVLLLAGCGGKNGASGTDSPSGGPSEAASASASGASGQNVVVTAFSSQGARITSFNDNLLTQKIEQKLGIKIDFQTAPSDGAKDKQNLLLSSGDYPAAFIGGSFNKVDQLKYGKLGVLIPLNDLIDQYAPNIKKAFEENPLLKKGVTAPDGNIYALPGLDGCDHCMYPAKLWINEQWLKKVNLSLPTTTDEFAKVLAAFKNDDPNGNGKADEIPLSGYVETGNEWGNPVNFLMNAFIYTDPTNYLRVKDGKVDLVADEPEWKQGLAYIRDLYAQKLIDPQTFTQNMSGIQQTAMNPDSIILGAYANLWNGDVMTIFGEAEDQRWNQYVAVPPLKGPGGAQYATYTEDRMPDAEFAITNKATKEQQIAAIRIADYLFTEEGALDAFLGVNAWVKAKDGQLGINGKPAIFDTTPQSDDWDAPTNALWENMFYYMSKDLYMGQAVSQDVNIQDGNETRLYRENQKYVGHEPPESERLPDLFIDPNDAQTVSELSTVINNYVKQNEVQFIIGKKNLDKDWDDYVNGLKKSGLDQYLQIYQKAYEANKQ